jgi:hypothetical protein
MDGFYDSVEGMRSPFRWLVIGSILVSCSLVGYVLLSAWRDFGYSTSDLPAILHTADDRSGFRFLVMGENEGDNPIFRTILDQASALDAAFLVHVADLTPSSDPADFSRVKDLLDTLPFPYYTAVGNNDIVKDTERSKYRALFSTKALGLPESNRTYYSFNYENAHFVVLDNADRKVGFSDEELSWLAADLAATNQQWTFLFFHRPVDVPVFGVFGDDETPTSRKSNERFVELISRYPIARIFNGHVHTFFTYDLGSIPVTISGGGGAAPHPSYGSILGPQYHYLEISVTDKEVTQTVHRIEE